MEPGVREWVMPGLMISLESLSMLDSTYPTTKVQMRSGLSGTGTSEDISMSTSEPVTSLLDAISAIALLAIRTLLAVTSLAGSSAVETLLAATPSLEAEWAYSVALTDVPSLPTVS